MSTSPTLLRPSTNPNPTLSPRTQPTSRGPRRQTGGRSRREAKGRRIGVLRTPGRDILLVDLDTFYVSVERVRDPSLVGRPVIVGGHPGERGVVACASYEARAYGVHAGMPLFQAAALLPRDTVFLHGDHASYGAASKKVMEILHRFSPQVEAVSLDEAYLDLTGCERHHRSWRDAATKIHRAVAEETGLAISIGIGATRAVAKIAASLAKPDGVLEVTRGEERAFLDALPLEHLPGVGPRMRRDLARFNLHTVGDLAAVSEEVLEETFGRVGLTLSRRARGLESSEDEAPVGHTVPKTRSISRETSFAQDTADEQFIDGMISYLGQRATRSLRKAGSLARSVGIRLRYADFQTVETRRRLSRPTDDDAEILEVARDLWRRRYDRRVRLRLVGVVLHDLVEVTDRQLELPFARRPQEGAPRPPEAPVPLRSAASLDHAIDCVRDRHGFGAVVRGNAVGLFGRLKHSGSGFRLHTPGCSR